MNEKSKRAVASVVKILGEFDEDERRGIFAALKRKGILPPPTRTRANQLEAPTTKPRLSKSRENTTSKAVSQLKQSHPEKYAILLEFEKLLRERSLLKEAVSLRDFALKIDKSMPKVKSRRDLISKLMAVLAPRDTDEIQRIIAEGVKEPRQSESDYGQLAEFIITGSRKSAQQQ